MADLNSIFSILAAADKQAQATNPYSGFEGIGDSLGNIIVKGAGARDDNGSARYDLGELIVSGLLSGALGGVGQGLGRNYRSEQNQLAQQSIRDIFSGGDIFRPEGMNKDVWGAIQGPAEIFRVQQGLENQQLGLKANYELRNELEKIKIGKALENPYSPQAQQILRAYGLGGGSQEPAPMVDSAPPAQAPQAQQGQRTPTPINPSVDFGANPLDLSTYANADAALVGGMNRASEFQPMKYEDYMWKFRGDKALAEAAMKRDLEAPDRQFKDLGDLRNEFQKRPEVQAYITSDIGFRSLKKAIKDPASTSDLELVRGAIQAIEPGMAVREGEQQAVYNSPSIPDQWRGTLAKALNGESALSPEVRQGILRIAQRRYDEYASTFNTARDFYTTQAKNRGLDPNGVTYLPAAESQPMVQTIQKTLKNGQTVNVRSLGGGRYEVVP